MGTVLKSCADCGRMTKIGATKSRCKKCRKADPMKFANRPPELGIKSRPGKERYDIKPFKGWYVKSLPKCVQPQNDVSGTSLTRIQFRFVLKSYGFQSYAEYLRSDLWLSVRTKVLDGATCNCGCGKKPDQVHHKVYTEANLLGISHRGLVAVHRDCHHGIEFQDGVKVRLPKANSELKRLRYQSVSDCQPPTEEEIKCFLSGKSRQLSDERKLVVAKYLSEKSKAKS